MFVFVPNSIKRIHTFIIERLRTALVRVSMLPEICSASAPPNFIREGGVGALQKVGVSSELLHMPFRSGS